MAHDPNHMTPCGLTYAQIDAKQAEYVRGANAALDARRHLGYQWWAYCVSHRTFEMVVGAPHEPNNLVISLAACRSFLQWQSCIAVCWAGKLAAADLGLILRHETPRSRNDDDHHDSLVVVGKLSR